MKPVFYDSLEEYMQERKGKNWRKTYMTIEMFEKFMTNDFYHLKLAVHASLWISLTILAAIIARWVIGG